ncbi:hypothetical protein FIV32_02390 [Sphingomonadales bacterium 58]|uniref:hypothetical protein n=1 Tax=Sphingobium sp. S8 TaxID=2758385 RepID=UPI001919825F|nr:hypothetical protein [Sphingobium sp. S8]MBY2957598.1 hypothetical protein [Sphingomonadales bacterium 58]CAD7335407.1 hypothetical protein SPHS8_00492 [Sphingobium sp. S8]
MADAGSAAGEAGGLIAGVVALLYAFGKGTAWLLDWKDARAKTRAAKLQAWHEELQQREEKQDERDRVYQRHIETQLRRQAVEIRVLRRAFELVADPLRRLEPDNPSLAQAQAMLDRAFPLDPATPEDLGSLLAMIDRPAPEVEVL